MNADSVKARLKNLAVKEGGTMQDKLVTYAMERSIYRLSISEYTDRFTLKGGIFLYALFDRKFVRATVDIDLLAHRIPNNSIEIQTVFQNIFSIQCDDALRYDLDSLHVRDITESKKYHGVNVSVNVYLDRTRIPVSIDIGFGDVVYPDRIQMEFPVLLDMDPPMIYAYSIYSVIAEKFEAFTSLGLINSRYKDFYDIYVLASKFDLSGADLQEAIQETFMHRGTGLDDIVAFEEGFSDDRTRQNRWKAFVKKKRAMEDISFRDTIAVVKNLLMPVVSAIQADSNWDKMWSCRERRWR